MALQRYSESFFKRNYESSKRGKKLKLFRLLKTGCESERHPVIHPFLSHRSSACTSFSQFCFLSCNLLSSDSHCPLRMDNSPGFLQIPCFPQIFVDGTEIPSTVKTEHCHTQECESERRSTCESTSKSHSAAAWWRTREAEAGESL